MTHHLSDILGIYPESQSCVGWAPSQGRHCRNPTNARNRRHAVSLLDQGTRLLKAGRSIDHILEELAPLVLCLRYHQNQAAGLTSTWVSRVDKYIASHQSPRSSPSRSMPRRSPSPRMRDETRAIENRLAELERKMQDAILKAERAEREKERARRDAERTRRDTEDMVRRSAAMGYARGQEEARRRASPPPTFETETTTVEHNEAYGFQRDSVSSGLLSSRRQDARGGSIETTLQVNTSTGMNVQLRRSTIVSTTRVQRTSDGPATPAQAERRAATPSSVSRVVEIGDTSDVLAIPSPAQQSNGNASSSPSTTSTRRAISLPSAETESANTTTTPNSEDRPSSTATQDPESTNPTGISETSIPNPPLPSPPTSNNEEFRSTPTGTQESSTTTQNTITPEPTTQPAPTSTSTSTHPSTPAPSTPPTISEHGITRHPIEGDCCICLCPLQRYPTQYSHNPEDDTSIVWCQKQCGNNFHRECMDRWIASALDCDRQTSCPMCRGKWQ
ncbi:hypothetical protein BO79DRAFT_245312 [Aspergillus costaricaensis CBS 115574]|uniref:Uncharacterized protein n=1 Tax=Aspergillus costaricaensis CBS 115574 TaxID=1448317 RepID=A0ACD1IEV3_9EURO|nr:hypothetical protein BO79DRAFT_245312 [Aspergillus costaricaensis CBS 115574]RAK88894.1 hypothetical protein BO79DRAFT_245312 [Aspergillus costaricaensis CBS 115574]